MKLALALCLLLAGCATDTGDTGVKFEDGDKARCKEHGCTVWTEQELNMLLRAAILKGFEAGKRAERNSL